MDRRSQPLPFYPAKATRTPLLFFFGISHEWRGMKQFNSFICQIVFSMTVEFKGERALTFSSLGL